MRRRRFLFQLKFVTFKDRTTCRLNRTSRGMKIILSRCINYSKIGISSTAFLPSSVADLLPPDFRKILGADSHGVVFTLPKHCFNFLPDVHRFQAFLLSLLYPRERERGEREKKQI